MVKYTEEYLIKKLGNCKNLIETATSDTQRTIYEGYLNFWIEKGYKKVEVVPEVELKPIDFTIDETSHANAFKIERAPKQAYYSRDGKMHKTKAFKEYLNQKTQ